MAPFKRGRFWLGDLCFFLLSSQYKMTMMERPAVCGFFQKYFALFLDLKSKCIPDRIWFRKSFKASSLSLCLWLQMQFKQLLNIA